MSPKSRKSGANRLIEVFYEPEIAKSGSNRLIEAFYEPEIAENYPNRLIEPSEYPKSNSDFVKTIAKCRNDKCFTFQSKSSGAIPLFYNSLQGYS